MTKLLNLKNLETFLSLREKEKKSRQKVVWWKYILQFLIRERNTKTRKKWERNQKSIFSHFLYVFLKGKENFIAHVPFTFTLFSVFCPKKALSDVTIAFQSQSHSSEVRNLCAMKWPRSKMLILFFSFRSVFFFSSINAPWAKSTYL